MQAQLEEYLKKIGIDESHYSAYNDASISSVSFEKNSQKLLIVIDLPYLFDVSIYHELVEKKNKIGNTSISFKLSNKPNDALITEYFKYFIDVCYKGVIKDMLKSLFVELYSDKLMIQVTSSLMEETLDSLKDVLEKCFKIIGLPYPIEVVCNSQNEVENIEKILEEENKKVQTNFLSSTSFENNTEIKKGTNTDFYKKEYKFIPIDEITNDDTRVDTQGRVFEAETITGRNGFKRFSFYVTNDKGSILVKTRESKTISIDTLNTIEEGDYIKLRGQMIYDSYIKFYLYILSNY